MMRRTWTSLGAAMALALAGCASPARQPPPSAGTATGAATGAVVGGVLGNVLSADGRRSENTAIGAALGAALGGGVGYAMDRQEQRRDADLAAERARTAADIEQLRRDVDRLELDRRAATAAPPTTARSPAPDPLRVVITPEQDTRVASEW